MSEEMPMMIAVRGFAVPISNEVNQPAPMLPGITLRKALSKPSDEALIFDCETTTDHKQNLRIGTYQLRKRKMLKESGIFYEPANLKPKEIKLLIAYAAERGLVLRTRDDFVREVFLLYAWRYGATVVGFNLPFDLSHIAIAASTSHGWDKPAVSRYSAATPSLLKWFSKLNKGKDYLDSVKPFNFMYAYHVSKTALGQAIANGTVNSDLLDGLPAVVAPFEDAAAKAVRKAFDRNTGRHVSPTILQTYRMAIAQYHLHDEAKFENGEHDDQGLTRRRHVRVIGVEYIGKEANRWEEQFYLGELPEAQIEYGTSAGGRHQFVKCAAKAANEFGKSALAVEAKLSRQQLYTILGSTAAPRESTVRRLFIAIAKLQRKGAATSKSLR